MKTSTSYSFEFQAQELPRKLSQLSREALTGYWLFEFPNLAETKIPNLWYLGLSEGNVVFSGNQQCCWNVVFEILQRYTVRLRNSNVKHSILSLEPQIVHASLDHQSFALLHLLNELNALNVISIDEIQESFRLRILSDLDIYLFQQPGRARFIPATQLALRGFNFGFDMEALLTAAIERRSLWQQLTALVPSLDCVPLLNTQVLQQSYLTLEQKQRLESLVSSNKTLHEIAVALAQDSLEVAKFFGRLISDKLIVLRATDSIENTEIFVIDDSPVLLRQFESLVTGWGYCVRSFCEPKIALKAMIDADPAVVFIDINMPDLTGFDLVKQIRRLPGLENTPLIMLTGDKSLSNNWRARWSGCQFMSKPLTPDEIPPFRLELRSILEELAPLPKPVQTTGRP